MPEPTTQQEREALLPCPFCGAPASGHAIEPHTHSIVFEGFKMPDHPGSYVIEGDCACGSGLIGDTQEEVTARWNRRAERDALRADAANHKERSEFLLRATREAQDLGSMWTAEVLAWRARFPQYTYRRQDDCVSLAARSKAGAPESQK